MLNRRDFLLSSSSLILLSLMTGCSQQEILEIFFLKQSIPPQLIASFHKQFNNAKTISFKPKNNVEDLFKLLQSWQEKKILEKKKFSLPSINLREKKERIGDLISISNYWLSQAVNTNLIEAINTDKVPLFNQLPEMFKNIAILSIDESLASNNLIWGVPYRYGFAMIAYREDKLKKINFMPKSWQDLTTKKELKNYISLLDNPREIIGLTLKKMGYSYNEKNIEKIPELKSELTTLHKQVKFYDSTNYLQPLILGDTWVAVGWSSDILPIIKNYPNIKAVIPSEGTSLWADLWVKPKNNNDNDSLIYDWINFCLQPNSVKQISLFSKASSPLLLTLNKSELPKDIINNNLIYPSLDILNKSEFINPLAKEIEQKYLDLWKEIRNN